jgi:dolichol kinase
MLTSELCRQSHSWRYLFDTAVYKSLRADEAPRIAAYAFFLAGYMFACIFLPYFAVVGLLAGGCLGDLAASQIGLRWGRHHFSHQSKTLEGWFAGIVVTYLASVLFLGFTLALVYLVLFAIVDFCTEKPIPISDNLLFPIMGILAFTLFSYLGVMPAPRFLRGI